MLLSLTRPLRAMDIFSLFSLFVEGFYVPQLCIRLVFDVVDHPVFLILHSTLTKKYYSKLQFTIVNYSVLQNHSFFIVPQFFSIVPQYFPYYHSFSIVNQNSKAINLFKTSIILIYFHTFSTINQSLLVFSNLQCFFFVNRSSIVLSIVQYVPQFCSQYHSFVQSTIVFSIVPQFFIVNQSSIIPQF